MSLAKFDIKINSNSLCLLQNINKISSQFCIVLQSGIIAKTWKLIEELKIGDISEVYLENKVH